MSETPPTDETTTPPPPGADPADPPFYEGLRRSRSDRVVAGIAGGLGHHFGIDPVLVRIGFVLLTVFGGSGVLLYLLAWLVIAKEGNDDTSAMRALRGSPEGNRYLLFAVLSLGAIFILGSLPSCFPWLAGAANALAVLALEDTAKFLEAHGVINTNLSSYTDGVNPNWARQAL